MQRSNVERERHINISFVRHMDYRPTFREVQSFIDDFREDFGVTVPFKDAERILVLYEEMADLFEEYSNGEIPPYQFFER